jgi:hypothetical protein
MISWTDTESGGEGEKTKGQLCILDTVRHHIPVEDVLPIFWAPSFGCAGFVPRPRPDEAKGLALVDGGGAAIAPHRSSLFAAAAFKGFPDDFGAGAAIAPQRSSSSLFDVDGFMSADFDVLLGGAAAIGPHKGSSSDFCAFS